METSVDQAEELKNLGNEEFKKNNFLAAIDYYTQAISKISSCWDKT